MAKGINIGVAADTQAFDRGVRSGVIEPLDDAAQALDDLAHSGDSSGRDLEHALRNQQTETEKLQRSYRNLNDEIQDGSSRSSRSMVESSEHATRESSEGFDEVRESARSNATEVAASFDGSAQSIADGFQGAAAEAFAGFGPAGAVAGIAVAAGLGLITATLEKNKEKAAELKQAASDMAAEFIETGKVGEVSLSYIADAMKTLATQTEEGKDSLTSLRQEADKAGVSVKNYQLANAGSAEATKKALKEARDEYGDLFDDINTYHTAGTKADHARLKGLGDTIGSLIDLRKTQKDAAKAAEDYYKSGAADLEAAGEAASTYADNVQSAYADAGSNIDDYVKKGKFDLDGYERAMEKNAKAIVDYQSNMATATASLGKSGHDKAIQYLEQLGPDAAPLIAAFIKAPAQQKSALAATWDTLGAAASSSFGTSLQSNLDAQVPTQTVKVKADMTDVNNQITALRQTKVTLAVGTNTPIGAGVLKPVP